eukprot:4475535-Alexandrium_andersonii.AAC.1
MRSKLNTSWFRVLWFGVSWFGALGFGASWFGAAASASRKTRLDENRSVGWGLLPLPRITSCHRWRGALGSLIAAA